MSAASAQIAAEADLSTQLLVERFKRIVACAEIARVSADMAEIAKSDDVRDANWSAHNSAVATLLRLICSEHGGELMDAIQRRLEGSA